MLLRLFFATNDGQNHRHEHEDRYDGATEHESPNGREEHCDADGSADPDQRAHETCRQQFRDRVRGAVRSRKYTWRPELTPT